MGISKSLKPIIYLLCTHGSSSFCVEIRHKERGKAHVSLNGEYSKSCQCALRKCVHSRFFYRYFKLHLPVGSCLWPCIRLGEDRKITASFASEVPVPVPRSFPKMILQCLKKKIRTLQKHESRSVLKFEFQCTCSTV